MSTPSQSRELFGHPIGLYVCFFTELWERFSFYGMKALLFFYLTKYHLFRDEDSYDLIGAYGGLVYAEKTAIEYCARARTAIAPFPDSPAKRALLEFVEFALKRNA